jgi:hypothetical protein
MEIWTDRLDMANYAYYFIKFIRYFLKEHSHEKVCEIISLSDSLVQTKVCQPFFNFWNRPSHHYDLLKEGFQNVKMTS